MFLFVWSGRKMNSNNFIFDSAFISTSENFECSMITPVAVPWVVHKPVVFTIFSSPSNDFNGMATKYLTGGMLVYSWFVWWKVWVDSESSLDWTICHNILLNRSNIIWNGVSLVAKGFVFLVCMSSISFLGFLQCFLAQITLVLKNKNCQKPDLECMWKYKLELVHHQYMADGRLGRDVRMAWVNMVYMWWCRHRVHQSGDQWMRCSPWRQVGIHHHSLHRMSRSMKWDLLQSTWYWF